MQIVPEATDPLIITIKENSSNISKGEAGYLVEQTVSLVNNILVKLKEGYAKTNKYILILRLFKKAGFSGKHFAAGIIKIAFNKDALTYPYTWNYNRWKDMPTIVMQDWVECFIHLLAHELAHSKHSIHSQVKEVGKKRNKKSLEFKCELIADDVLKAFRKIRPLVELKLNKIRKIENPNLVKMSTQKPPAVEKAKETPVPKKVKDLSKSTWAKEYKWMREYIKDNKIKKEYTGKESFKLFAPGGFIFGEGEAVLECNTNKEGYKMLKAAILKEVNAVETK